MVARDEAQHLRAQYDFVVCGPDPLGLGRGFKVAFQAVPAPVWEEPKGHLLPFCSHTILKHPEKRGTSNYQEGTDIYSSFRTVFARSEGYRQSPEATHNPKVVG